MSGEGGIPLSVEPTPQLDPKVLEFETWDWTSLDWNLLRSGKHLQPVLLDDIQ